MSSQLTSVDSPFGEADCESELISKTTSYRDLFFHETPFNKPSLESRSYLIVGRRGSGKTALCQFFRFQQETLNATIITIDQAELFGEVLQRIGQLGELQKDAAASQIAKMWEWILWSVIARSLNLEFKGLRQVLLVEPSQTSPARHIRDILRRVLSIIIRDQEGTIFSKIEHILESKVMQQLRDTVLGKSAQSPIFLALDTAEHYDVNDWPKMIAVAGLVECVSTFNRRYAPEGLHVKLLLPAESYPSLQERYVSNPGKYIRNPVHLNWRPRDLLRLICWRFHCHLAGHDLLLPESRGEIEWDSFKSVRSTMWDPYFGSEVTSRTGFREPSFVYILRHTQMRPRQLIILCNHIAAKALAEGNFPRFTEEQIRHAVRDKEVDLAQEVINSYAFVHPCVDAIIEGLMGSEVNLRGKDIDVAASRTASQWPHGDYSQFAFRHLVAQLGIVGRVRHQSDDVGIIEADFEYAIKGRLGLTEKDNCVIHPMFCAKLNTRMKRPIRVLPFPDAPEYSDVAHRR